MEKYGIIVDIILIVKYNKIDFINLQNIPSN